MKKIISLIASIAMLASMATSVFAADLANNANPVVDVTMVEELSAESYYDWMGVDLPAGEKAYLVDVTVNNVDLSSKALGKSGTNAKKRTGTIMMYTDMYLSIDDASKITAVEVVDGANSNATLAASLDGDLIKCMFNAGNAKQGAPEISDGTTTAATTDSVLAVEFIVTATGSFTATVAQEPKLKFTNFEADTPGDTLNLGAAEVNHATWTVNGEEGSSITFGEKEPDPVPDPVEEFVYGTKRDLKDGETVIGYSWDLTINGFDSTKTYTAKFTAGGEEKVNELNFDNAEVALDGSVAFAALLKTTRTAVEIALAKN